MGIRKAPNFEMHEMNVNHTFAVAPPQLLPAPAAQP